MYFSKRNKLGGCLGVGVFVGVRILRRYETEETDVVG